MIFIAATDADIENCFDVINELRPQLVRDQFVQTVRSMQEQGFKLAFLQVDSQVVAVAGYRIYNNLYMGKHCYIDDLVTASAHRSKGYGEKMIAWLRHQALQAGCDFLHLDSGTHRGRAHKFYFDQGFTIASYHFSEALR
jgi:GNAT superfamily N-acetyltransferase